MPVFRDLAVSFHNLDAEEGMKMDKLATVCSMGKEWGLLIGTSCLFLSAQNTNNATVAGSWKGTFANSVGSGTLYVILKQEASGVVSRNYDASSRG